MLSRDIVFIHDNARPHTANVTKYDKCLNNGGNYVEK
jgi:hypothetical protein